MARLNKEYDVIVIGGGINGLACAAYLQKSGLNVVVFESLPECGIQCRTEELLHPGLKVQLTVNMMLNMHSPAFDELELEKFGLDMVPSSEWAYFYPFRRDKSAVLCHAWDSRKTYQAWQRINKHDAEVYRKLVDYFAPRFRDWYEQMVFRVLTEETMMNLVQDMKACPVLPSDVATMSPAQLVDELYQDDRIKTHALAMDLLFDCDPLQKGFAISSLLNGPLTSHMIYQTGIARGGAQALTDALARCFVHYGGTIFTSCPVARIIVENGETKGVVLSKSAAYPEAEIRARKGVASDLTLHPTFIDLVGLDKIPQYADAIKTYTYDAVILFVNYWALSEPLDWEGAGFPRELNRTFSFNYGLDDGIKDIMRGKSDWKAHRLPDPPIVCGQSVQGCCFADPTLAPPGQHTLMSFTNVTYDLDQPGGAAAWDGIKENYGDKVENLLAEYVPNIKKAKIGRYCESPLGFSRRNPSQTKGHWFAAKIPSQSGLNAPFPGCGAPRTPIPGLYIIRYMGTSSILDAGYRCADILAQDAGVREKQEWWNVRPFEPQMKWFKKQGIQTHWAVD